MTLSMLTRQYFPSNSLIVTITIPSAAATTLAAGLMSKDDKIKLNGISAGAQVNSVTGVKGNSESAYRTGNVNITANNIGAAASSHTHNYAGSSSAGGAATSATKLATARTISIGGGASGTASFNGSADAKISLGSINAASITSGTLAVARGGTGQTSLSNVTVGKASKLETARSINGFSFDGSANVKNFAICSTAASDPVKVCSFTNLDLSTFPNIIVQFNNINTATSAASLQAGNQTLPIIRKGGSVIGAFTNARYTHVHFQFENNRWVIVEPNLDVSLATAGTLAVARGGTGQTTLALARNAMGLGNTTGALPVANGGTGLTASPSMLTNLASTSAANIMAASPRPGVTGTLGVGNGGTGQTSLANVTVGKADKLTTARKITIDGYVAGLVNFDGSDNVTLSTSWNAIYLDPATTPDLNTVKTPGWYRGRDVNKFYHRPATASTPWSSFHLHVVGVTFWSTCMQELYLRWGGPRFIRVSNDFGQTWGSWQKYNMTVVDTCETIEGGDS